MTKHEMVTRMRRGEFGNTLRTWYTWDEFVKDRIKLCQRYGRWVCDHGDYDRLFGMRTKVAGGRFREEVVPSQLTPSDFETHYLSDAAPDRQRIVQGEYWDGDHGPYFLHSYEATHMVAALRGRFVKLATGIGAIELIRAHMDHHSFDNLQCIREQWPGHVVEFTVFGCGTGTLGWNTVFWEVRDY